MKFRVKSLPVRRTAMALLWVYATAASAELTTLRMAIPPEGYPPYIITPKTPSKQPHNDNTGIMVEVLREALDDTDIAVEFHPLPEIRARMMMDQGQMDVRTDSHVWIEDAESFLWSVPVANINDIYVFLRESSNVFEQDASMVGAEIVTHLGYSYPTFEDKFASGDLHRDDRQSEMFMLNALIQWKGAQLRRVHKAVVMDELVARWLILNNDQFKGQFEFSSRRIDSAPYQFQFADRPELVPVLEKINDEIKRMRDSGTLEKITRQILSQGE